MRPAICFVMWAAPRFIFFAWLTCAGEYLPRPHPRPALDASVYSMRTAR